MRFAATSLVWVDRNGREEPIEAPQRAYYSLRLSPDGRRVALDVRDGQYDTWTLDLERLTLDKVTSSPRNDPFPVWSPDGRRIVTGDGPGLVWRPADGSGADEALTTASHIQFPMSFSPDGRLLSGMENTSSLKTDHMKDRLKSYLALGALVVLCLWLFSPSTV